MGYTWLWKTLGITHDEGVRVGKARAKGKKRRNAGDISALTAALPRIDALHDVPSFDDLHIDDAQRSAFEAFCADRAREDETAAAELRPDLVLLDVKQINAERHKTLTGRSNEQTLLTAEWLETHKRPFWLRYVLVPGYSDDEKDIRQLGEHFKQYTMIERVEILPYHRLGTQKYIFLDRVPPMGDVTLDDKKFSALRKIAVATLGDRVHIPR